MGLEQSERAAITELIDIEAIKKLHAKYAFLVDEHKWDDVINLFTEDATGDWGFGAPGSRGKHQGREEITRFFKVLVNAEASMFRHMLVQPYIEVSGDSAHAQWYMSGFGTFNVPDGEVAVWTHGKYMNDVVKVNGEWKFSYLRYQFTFQTPYDEGWLKTRTIMPTVFKEEEQKIQ